MITVRIWKDSDSFLEGSLPWWEQSGTNGCEIFNDSLYIEFSDGGNISLPKGQLVVEEIREKAEETSKALDLDTPLKQPGYSVLITKRGEDANLILETLAQDPDPTNVTVLANSGNDPVIVILSDQGLRGDVLYRLQEFANTYLATEEPK